MEILFGPRSFGGATLPGIKEVANLCKPYPVQGKSDDAIVNQNGSPSFVTQILGIVILGGRRFRGSNGDSVIDLNGRDRISQDPNTTQSGTYVVLHTIHKDGLVKPFGTGNLLTPFYCSRICYVSHKRYVGHTDILQLRVRDTTLIGHYERS